jgi:sulfite reductase (NADPH) hemoprotein beta-component
MSEPARPDLSRPLHELHSNEQLKQESRFLRGTLEESLVDPLTGAVSESDGLLTKFFGIYQQDDRDFRDARRRAKLEPRYQFMVRVRLPGGVCTPAQWLALDALARNFADGSLRLTTRQTFQFHGIRKRNLRAHIQGIRHVGLDTVAACGDDNRNVICTANPLLSKAHAAVSALARAIGAQLLPRTAAYGEVFLQEPKLPRSAEEEPLYGPTYLPRKFKIALAVPPSNDIDLFAHDLGFIAITDGERIRGFNVLVGGGMGMTHKVTNTFPRLSEVAGFCTPEEVCEVAEHTLCIQRDHGNRKDRSRARFKYTLEDLGLAWFVEELARRRGRPLQAAQPFHFATSADRFGWHQGLDGRWHLGLFVESGRVCDRPRQQLMTALRLIAGQHSGLFALTTNQNLIVAGVAAEDRAAIDGVLRDHGIAAGDPWSRNAIACVALPTCALAMAESERYLPHLLTQLRSIAAEAGLAQEPISIRISGCPNGCSRPYLAEIALVGKAPGKYNLYLGGSASGERLNSLYRENVGEARILADLADLLGRFAAERVGGERFGDFVLRVGVVRPVVHGRDFQRSATLGG